jgi:hypothetical protein
MTFKTIVITVWILIVVPTMTYALFIDTHSSKGNTFSATTLETNSTTEFPTPIVRKITPEEKIVFSFKLYNVGKLDTQNTLYIAKNNNKDFLSLIWVDVILDETKPIYSGYLDKMEIPSYLIQPVGGANAISFTFSISEEHYNESPEEEVRFVIRNHAWQTTLPYGSGFFDNEDIDVTLTNPLPLPLRTPAENIFEIKIENA